MDFRSIRQTSRINGQNRNPGPLEHNKAMTWDNDMQEIKYMPFETAVINSKTSNGYVLKGNDAASASYVWKLDNDKNPGWRAEKYLSSIQKAEAGNDLTLTMSDGEVLTVSLGALAWLNTLPSSVSSVFGRQGNVVAAVGDYTAAQVTNAFDKSANTLDDILEGTANKHFTVSYKDAVLLNTAARHSHSNKPILDQITSAGGGVIPTTNQINNWDDLVINIQETIRDTTAAFIQNSTGINWTHNDAGDTLTPAINLGAFTTDNLPEGAVNKYYNSNTSKNVFSIILPAAGTTAERCLNPTLLPAGWTVTASGSGVDLLVTHNLSRATANVTVWSISPSTGAERLLLSNAAYSGILTTGNKNSLTVEALATILTPIRINITLV